MREPTPGLDGIADAVLQSELLREAGRLTRNAADAHDLVQDTLERGLRKQEHYRYGSLRAWLMHIMRNLFIDRCRRRRPTAANVEVLSIPAEATALPRWAQVSDDALAAAIDALTPLGREVVILKEREGCSYEEIAARLGIPMSTVGTRLRRARQKLRQFLTGSSSGGTALDEDEEDADARVH